MGHAYQAVGWNRQKRIYDLVLAGGIFATLAVHAIATLALRPDATAETILIRGFGTVAFLLLHVVLSIGPLCRLDRRFLPLLYNRRHMGVAMFFLAAGHGTLSFVLFHALGVISPLASLFAGDTGTTGFAGLPFQPLGAVALGILYLMAATSHDFWLRNLTPAAWKALHMLVYVAWALVVMHVALGFLQSDTSPWLAGLVACGVAWIIGLHLVAAWRERRRDEAPPPDAQGWVDAGPVAAIPQGRASVVTAAGERVAVFRHGDKLSAVASACRHQGGPLGEGRVVDGCIVCPWHGYQYRPEDGRSPAPFTEMVPTYRVRVVSGRAQVQARPLPSGTPVEPASCAGIVPAEDDQEQYVGYLPRSPRSQARFTALAACAVLAACLAAVAIVALAAAGAAAWKLWFAPSPGRVIVVLNVTPWATIEAITRKSGGSAVAHGCGTVPPRCRVQLEPGEYIVRASNPNYGATAQFDLTVRKGPIQEETRALPGIRPEDDVDAILRRLP